MPPSDLEKLHVSTPYDFVFYSASEDSYYYTDDCGCDLYGPYPSEVVCRAYLSLYSEAVTGV